MPKTVVALYDDFGEINDAVRDLLDRGFHRDEISIIANDADRRYSQYLEGDRVMEPPDESGAAEGAGLGASIGALIGGIGGILAGVGALVIPVIGPVVAAGPLAVALSGLVGAGAGALAGGVAGGLVGALVDLGIPEETAGYYMEGVRRGGTLIAVRAADHQADVVREILNRHNPIDLAERSAAWRRTGWAGPSQTVYTLNDEDDRAFRTHFESSPYASREGYDRYAPAYQYGYQMGITPGFAGQEWEVIEPQIRTDWDSRQYGRWEDYRDAIHFGYSRASERSEMEFAAYEDHFRTRFTETPHARTDDYAQHRPAYRFGWNMGKNPRYFEYEWEDIEENLRQNWETQNPGTWDQYQNAIHEGWEAQRTREAEMPVTGQPRVADRSRYERQDIDTEPIGATTREPLNIDEYGNTFQQHFNSSPWSSKSTYAQHEPAYHYGFNLGLQPNNKDRSWADVEPQARNEWERRQPGSWNDYRDAVRYGWVQARRER